MEECILLIPLGSFQFIKYAVLHESLSKLDVGRIVFLLILQLSISRKSKGEEFLQDFYGIRAWVLQIPILSPMWFYMKLLSDIILEI